MNEKISELILQWHHVYVSLSESIEHARVVLDQTDRGTLLPDRVREMRGHLISVRERIPKLALLLEELIDETVWPMKVEEPSLVAAPIAEVTEAEAVAEMAFAAADKPPVTGEGDYDAAGSTPTEQATVDEETAAEEVSGADNAYGDPDATDTP